MFVFYYDAPLGPFTAWDVHRSCYPEPNYVQGTDANAFYWVSLTGGGCGWVTGNGVQDRAAWIKLRFVEWSSNDPDSQPQWNVSLRDAGFYPIPGCAGGPAIYGHLASPDLNGDLSVDAADLPLLSARLGQPVTLVDGWQADFNHSGTVDAGDIAYMAARLGVFCGYQKAGTDAYDANVHNLELDYLEDFLDEHGVTKVQILAAWDEMGLSYDRSAAVTVLSGRAIVESSFSEVKRLYR